MDTIFALSSGRPPSGIAVIRVSGPRCVDIGGYLDLPLVERVMRLVTIRDRNNRLIDSGLGVYFPAPKSFTSEDCLELHVHGSAAVVDAVSELLSSFPDVRAAEPGEFAKRAFLAGKIDLTEAEGLAALIDAETRLQLEAANQQASGVVRHLYEAWSEKLVSLEALIMAHIDFSDEDDVPEEVAEDILGQITALKVEIERHLKSLRRTRVLQDGYRIALVGRPNAGKSSLMNFLAESDRVIVSDQPGTTRDVVEVRMDIGGYLAVLGDTAGIDEAATGLEAAGVSRSIDYAREADLVLYLDENGDFGALDRSVWGAVIEVRSKADLREPIGDALSISTMTGAGMDGLVGTIENAIRGHVGERPDVLPVQERHGVYLQRAVSVLGECGSDEMNAPEIVAEHLRAAGEAIGRITGTRDVEDILGAVFSRFCIGK